MLRGLRDGKLHVALLIQVSAKVLAGLVFEELHRFAVCVAVHPAHPLARVRKVGLEQVGNERLIAYTLADYPEMQTDDSPRAAKPSTACGAARRAIPGFRCRR